MDFLKNLKIELLYDPVIPHLGVYPEKPKTLIQNIFTPIFISALFTTTKTWEQPKHPSKVNTVKWREKAVIHLHNGILLGHNKEGNFSFCSSLDGPREHYAKWNKPVRKGKAPCDLIFMWNLKTHRYREQTDSCQKRGRLCVWMKKSKGLRKKKNTDRKK